MTDKEFRELLSMLRNKYGVEDEDVTAINDQVIKYQYALREVMKAAEKSLEVDRFVIKREALKRILKIATNGLELED